MGAAPAQQSPITVVVSTLNIEERGNTSLSSQAIRIRRAGEMFSLVSPETHVLALQELLTSKHQKIWNYSPIYMEANAIPCGNDPLYILPVNCFTTFFPDPWPKFRTQYGENGLASNGNLQLIHGSQRSALLHRYPDTNVRQVHGARFEATPYHPRLPVYSVHLSSAGDAMDRFTAEINTLIAKVREWQQPGDFTPVIAGDFNCTRWTPGVRGLMYQHFFPASSDLRLIDIIWVGRPQSFPGSAGALRRFGASSHTYVLSDAGLTDPGHPLLTTTLEYEPATAQNPVPLPTQLPETGCFNEYHSVQLNSYDFNPRTGGNYVINWPGPPRHALQYSEVYHFYPFFNVHHTHAQFPVDAVFDVMERRNLKSDIRLGYFNVSFLPNGVGYVAYPSAVQGALTPLGAPSETIGSFWLGCTPSGRVRGNAGAGDDGKARVYLRATGPANFRAPEISAEHLVRCY
jgi:hypothetical protein